MMAPLIIMIIGTSLGITTPAMTAKFPAILQCLTYDFGAGGGLLGIGSLFGLGAIVGEEEYYDDKIDYTNKRIKDLEMVRDSSRYKDR